MAAAIFAGYQVRDDAVLFEFDVDDVRVNIVIADSEFAGLTQQQLRDLVAAKLRRAVNREGIAARLDPLIGQTITI